MKTLYLKVLFAVLAISIAVFFSFQVPEQLAAANSKSSFLYSRVTPFAVFMDGSENYVIEVAVTGDTVKLAALAYYSHSVEPSEKVLINGEYCFMLYDDGTHGDRVANDGIYSIELKARSLNVYQLGGASMFGEIIYIVHEGAVYDPEKGYIGNHVEEASASMGIVDPGLKNSYLLTQLAEEIYATEYAIFIVDQDNLLLSGFPLVEVACFDTDFMTAAAKKIYKIFPDVFDFITVMPGGTMYDPRSLLSYGFAENVPFFVPVSQQVENIGLSLFDNSHDWGSQECLKGVIYHSFGGLDILAHEVGHNWGVLYGKDFGLVKGTDPHWVANIALNDYDTMAHYFFSDGNAYAFRNQNGRLEAITNLESYGDRRPGYSDLTLYLMGLLPAGEVKPALVLINPIVKEDGTVTTDKITEVTIEQLIAVEGERIPSYEDTQKEFNMAFVVITQDIPTEGEAAFISGMSEYFGSQKGPEMTTIPFYAATRGRGTMNTNITKAGDNMPAISIPGTETGDDDTIEPEDTDYAKELPQDISESNTPWFFIIPAVILFFGIIIFVTLRKVKL